MIGKYLGFYFGVLNRGKLHQLTESQSRYEKGYNKPSHSKNMVDFEHLAYKLSFAIQRSINSPVLTLTLASGVCRKTLPTPTESVSR